MIVKDHYSVLGVTSESSIDEIKKAYKKLALDNHPDRNPNDKLAAEKFKEVTHAYSVLSDTLKRQEYDRVNAPQDYSFHTFNFKPGTTFNFNFYPEDDEPKPGEDHEIEHNISLKESILGCTKSILLDSNIECICEKCKGTGARDGKRIICISCLGQGKIPDFRVGVGPRLKACLICKGKGTKPIVNCNECKGTGTGYKKRDINIKIPPGIESGQKLRLSGLGLSGTPPGDLYIVIKILPDARIHRNGQNLSVVHKISLIDAIKGTSTEIDSTSGKKLKIIIPPGIQQLHEIVLQGEGVPKSIGKETGNLHVIIHIEMPSKLSEKAKKLIDELAKELN